MTIVHKANSQGAELSCAMLDNDYCLLKVNGLTQDYIDNSGYTDSVKFTFADDDKVGRLAFYNANKFPEEII